MLSLPFTILLVVLVVVLVVLGAGGALLALAALLGAVRAPELEGFGPSGSRWAPEELDRARRAVARTPAPVPAAAPAPPERELAGSPARS